ncbi:MAG: tRNA lysidine(34) synthetase TilS [Hespellia sp.]|nr:tRNA lysidine(34) synthetase TilS [Hespellia sp.]
MNEKVRIYMEKYHMLVPGDKVIVGVSGGADSVCLFSMLADYRLEMDFSMVAVHVNHNLRGQAALDDQQYVERLCEQAGVPLEICSEDVAAYAREQKQSLEEAGREVRRRAFASAKEKFGATKIATAHHMNDNAETMLLNLARGTGLKGLGGISPYGDGIIRPLLCLTRAEIERYLAKRQIPYCTDESNRSNAYTRNRIRNHVIPYLESEINEKCVAHMNETMEQLRSLQEYVSQQMNLLLSNGTRESKGRLYLEQCIFTESADVLVNTAILQVLKDISGKEKDLSAVHVQLVRELFDKQVGRSVDLPYNMQAVRSYDGIMICRKGEQTTGRIEPVPLLIPGEQTVFLPGRQAIPLSDGLGDSNSEYGKDAEDGIWKMESGNMEIECTVLDTFSIDGIPQKPYTKWFDYDIIVNTLVVRGRQQGDIISVSRNGGTQKLKSYFTNEKIPGSRRDLIPLIADGSHILWIVGYRMSSAYQVTGNTKRVLQIRIKNIQTECPDHMEEK